MTIPTADIPTADVTSSPLASGVDPGADGILRALESLTPAEKGEVA